MEKRVELEKRGKNPAEIKELVLDNCKSPQIVGLTDEFCNLEVLSLINVGLTNLKGFPKLPKLKKLELSDNRIVGGLNYLSGSPNLKSLNLSGNKIATLDVLEPLKEFKNLKQLDLFNCEITSVENYKEKVFALIPSLSILDGFDQNDREVDEDSEEENGTCSKFNDEDSELEDEEDDDEDDDDEDEEDSEDGEEEEVGLEYLTNSIDEDSEGEDYEPKGVAVESDDDEEDSDEDEAPKGKKRKIDNEE